MPQPQPVIDGFEFASAGASLTGALSIHDFPRLRDMLAELRCQRCLEALPFEIEADEVLVLAGTQAEIDAEPADVDAADRVVAAKEMPVRELVEDELILALPYAPRHADCSARASADAAEKTLPFASLRGLMRGKH
jgi:uncharacterized protein